MTAMASCSTEDIVDVASSTDDEITFRASVGFTSDSRGIESSDAVLNSFYVSAFPVGQEGSPLFENALFYKKNDKFVTENEYKWSHELKLDIFAYGYCNKDKKDLLPKDINESALVKWGPEKDDLAEVTATCDQRTINNFSPNPDIAKQVDFIFTKQLDVTQPGMTNSVALVFDHMLSEIGVDAICKSKTHRVKIAKVKYGNIYSKGDFQMDNSTWNELRNKTTYEIELPAPVILGNEAKNISLAEKVTSPIGFAILLPQCHSTFNSTTEYFGKGNDRQGPTYTYDGEIREKTLVSAQYLAVLCRIEVLDKDGVPTGTLKFPVKEDYYVEVPVDENNSEVYGWAYLPFHLAKDNDSAEDKAKYSQWQMGNRYRYHLDFTDGAGYNDDGNNILEGPVTFTASVNPWNNVNIDRPRTVSSESTPTTGTTE